MFESTSAREGKRGFQEAPARRTHGKDFCLTSTAMLKTSQTLDSGRGEEGEGSGEAATRRRTERVQHRVQDHPLLDVVRT